SPFHLLTPSPLHAKDVLLNSDDLHPGLVAHYRSLADADAQLDRIDVKPAFTLGHSSPHPRLPPGPFEAAWTGLLELRDPGRIRFDAFLCGEATVEIDGVTVFEGRGERETAHVESGQPLTREPGLYRLRIRYGSLPDLPARLQLGWRGPTFAREPLPA